jgi:alcohol dehydrogenase (cytochrome c)
MNLRTVLLVAAAATAWTQVSPERIQNADREPGNWLTYSRTYSGHRYTPLTEITAANVGQLRAAWTYQIQQPGKFSTSPIVIDGVLYITEPGGEVVALDGRTGRPVWRYGRKLPPDLHACCGSANRGMAALQDLLFVGTLDAHLLAIDLETGKLRWDTVVADYRAGYAITVAPLAFGDKVVVGIAGGEYGIRGFLDAYDAKRGRQEKSASAHGSCRNASQTGPLLPPIVGRFLKNQPPPQHNVSTRCT